MSENKRILYYQYIFCLLACLWGTSTFAWNTVNGLPVCTATGYQYTPLMVTDGSGGAIITWTDNRNMVTLATESSDIYAQRINSNGSTLWTTNGVVISTSLFDQVNPTIAGDNAGGAYITWQDYRNTTHSIDIYLQHINSQGSSLWAPNGISICTADSYQTYPQVVGDGSGGAVVGWMDYRFGQGDVYAQRVNSAGSTLWTLNGVAISTNVNYQYYPTIASDSSGGAILTWYDLRNGPNDIYAQRVNGSGTTVWTTNGIAICTAALEQYYPQIIDDASGGAFISWYDARSNSTTHLYAQHVNSNGSTLWTFNGLAICTAINYQSSPQLINDGNHGTIISWVDTRLGSSHIYAQRVNSAGSTLWLANGLAICTSTAYQNSQNLVSDGAGGAIITWQDFRSTTSFSNIYAQHVDSTGTNQWTANGVAISTFTSGGTSSPTITSNGFGGAIITYMDYRQSGDINIYAQSISNTGVVPVNDWFIYAHDISYLRKE